MPMYNNTYDNAAVEYLPTILKTPNRGDVAIEARVSISDEALMSRQLSFIIDGADGLKNAYRYWAMPPSSRRR